MRIDKIYIEEFKNLRDFHIDLDQSKMHTVLLGENAAGKSNLLEALVIIFRDLDLQHTCFFNYEIEYQCRGNLLKVKGGPDISGGFQFYKGLKLVDLTIGYDVKPLSKKVIYENKSDYLPKYVFSYYSGVSNRLLEHFDTHQRRFYSDLLDGIDNPMRPLFYARLIHSHFVLMAFYAFKHRDIDDFLKDYLSIVGLESVLFVFKKPLWDKTNKNPLDFWGAKGVVRNFLNDLWDAALGPIVHSEPVREDFRKSPIEEHLFLYISNQEKLEKIARKYANNTEFFKSLESTYISDLIYEVKVRVKKQNIKGDITFKELSEGEQQLLTVLGLLRFTKEEESLILLDEPDTHLNPLWKWQYMNLLEKVVQKPESSQIIMTTHDPLVIGGLTKEEIRIFYAQKETDEEGNEVRHIKTMQPDFDPKGLGVAGILTGEFFNLPSTLDPETQNDLMAYRNLEALSRKGELNPAQKTKLEEYRTYFDSLGFNKYTRDPLYNLFLKRLFERKEFQSPPQNEKEREKQNELALSILDKLLSEEQE